MAISHLRHRRQLNVRQQNARTAQRIEEQARFWREQGVPAALEAYAYSRGVNWAGSIIVYLEIDFPGMPALFGLLLNDDERFIRFELDTDPQHLQVMAVECWQDVTEQQNLNERNPGIGMGCGAIARRVRNRLCNGAMPSSGGGLFCIDE